MGLPTGRHKSFGAFVVTTDTATMALTARLTALEQKTEQRHEQTQNTLSQISNGTQGIMMALEHSISLTTQQGAGFVSLVSHVNTTNAALTASGASPIFRRHCRSWSRWR